MEQEQSHFAQQKIPEPLPVNFERLPKRIQPLHQFVVWRYVQVEDELKKPPFDPRTGKRASVANPKSWGSFAEARRAYATGRFAGIGIVLTQALGIVGIDIDHCIQEGQPSHEAKQMVSALGSYTETSPSGTGIRILLAGTLPGPYRRRGTIEMYEDRRFLTLTGHIFPTMPEDVQHRQAEVSALYQRLFAQEDRKPTPENTGGWGWQLLQTPLPTVAVLQKAMTAKNGPTFKRYYEGDTSLWEGAGARHRSQSEADFTLVLLLLYWTNGDTQAVDQLFRTSGLMRDKWDRPVKGQETYGQRLINDALTKRRY
jgi:putative DNA primase/helicase